MKKTTKPVVTVEKRRFGMHPKLLLDVIRRQAGTLAKAVMEAVMNSIDAGAKVCDIEIGSARVSIRDDGKGISDRTQVEQFFETFGQPHSEDEGKRYGTFRMGRGQLFAYGANTWRTGPFEMLVDVSRRGLDYDLKTLKKSTVGCEIDIVLYEALVPSGVADTVRTVKQWVKYATGIVISVNGELANHDPAEDDWDHVTDDAFVRLSRGSGSLTVYNLGVHTLDYGSYRFGVGGTVVSRQQLKVNFARNDIQSDCPVWRRVKALVEKEALNGVEKKTTLTDAERTRICQLVAQGEAPDGAKDLRLFTSVTGRNFSAVELCRYAYKYGRKMTACPKGTRRGARLFETKVAFVLASETLQSMDVDLHKFETLVACLGASRHQLKAADPVYTVVAFRDLSAGLPDRYEIVADADLSLAETLWLDLARRAVADLQHGSEFVGQRHAVRKVVIGESDNAEGWTDGFTFIALDRKFVEGLEFSTRGIVDLGALIIHELIHDGSDAATHDHGPEFYEAYHAAILRALPEFVERCLRVLPNVLNAGRGQLAKKFMKDRDRAARTKLQLTSMLSRVDKCWDEVQ